MVVIAMTRCPIRNSPSRYRCLYRPNNTFYYGGSRTEIREIYLRELIAINRINIVMRYSIAHSIEQSNRRAYACGQRQQIESTWVLSDCGQVRARSMISAHFRSAPSMYVE
jgi:hypothetical protein